jgi:hypothetical protein
LIFSNLVVGRRLSHPRRSDVLNLRQDRFHTVSVVLIHHSENVPNWVFRSLHVDLVLLNYSIGNVLLPSHSVDFDLLLESVLFVAPVAVLVVLLLVE